MWKAVAVILGALLLLLQYRLWAGQGGLAELAGLERAIVAQQAANRELGTRNRVLEVEVSDLKDGLDTVEEIAREELGMIREGEAFYLLIEGD